MNRLGIGTSHDVVTARLEAIRAGTGPSLVGAVACGAYDLATWDSPNRPALLTMAVLSFVATGLVAKLPMRRIVGGRGATAFFLSWSASLVGVVAVGAHLDGGPGSPLWALLFLPLPYAALCYPVRQVLCVAAMVVGAFLTVVIADAGPPTAGTLLIATAFALGGWLCAWLAGIHQRQRAALDHLSVTDPLTGCLNRRGFEQRFEAALALAVREDRPVTLVTFDLDGFKTINDRDGHKAGDTVLRQVGEALRSGVRVSDAVGRIGGDEFAVLLDAPAGAAQRVAGRLASACGEFVGVSHGCATYPEDAGDPDALGQVADRRLYADKLARRFV